MAKAIAKPVALAIAAGIALGGSFGAGAPAFAQVDNDQESVGEESSQVLPHASAIPDTKDFSLTLHKSLNPRIQGEASGNEDQHVSGEPLNGAHFQLQKLHGNIREQAGLSNLAQLPMNLTVHEEIGRATVVSRPLHWMKTSRHAPA